MIFLGIVKSSKTRLSLRVHDEKGCGELISFRSTKSGVLCVDYASFKENGFVSFPHGVLSVVYFSDAWRVEFTSIIDGSVFVLEINF